jgi:hypothetical protein
VLMIFPRLVPVLIKPRSRLTHQQAGYIPMVKKNLVPLLYPIFSQRFLEHTASRMVLVIS